MGADLLLEAAVIDAEATPDWAAAERSIEELKSFEDLHDPYCFGAETIAEAKGALRERLDVLREAMEGAIRRDLNELVIRGARVVISGGPSWGDVPTEMFEVISNLHREGVLEAAGFDMEAHRAPRPTVLEALRIALEDRGCEREALAAVLVPATEDEVWRSVGPLLDQLEDAVRARETS